MLLNIRDLSYILSSIDLKIRDMQIQPEKNKEELKEIDIILNSEPTTYNIELLIEWDQRNA